MGATISLNIHSNATELATAARVSNKPTAVSQIILEQDIDVATALELDHEDLMDITPRKLDQKKLKAALKHLRRYLMVPFPTGSQHILASSMSEHSLHGPRHLNHLVPLNRPLHSMSTSVLPPYSTPTNDSHGLAHNAHTVLPRTLRLGLLQSVDGTSTSGGKIDHILRFNDTHDPATAAGDDENLRQDSTHENNENNDNNRSWYNNQPSLFPTTTFTPDTPGRGLMVLNTLCESNTTRSLITSDTSVVASVLSSLNKYGVQRVDVAEQGLKILLRCCYVAENIELCIHGSRTNNQEWNGLRLVLNLLKEHGSTQAAIVEYCISILWLAGAAMERHKKSIEGTFGLEIFKAILWQFVLYKEHKSIVATCCLALSTHLDLKNLSIVEYLLDGEGLHIVFDSALRKYSTWGVFVWVGLMGGWVCWCVLVWCVVWCVCVLCACMCVCVCVLCPMWHPVVPMFAYCVC
jgi:hypothetical protein